MAIVKGPMRELALFAGVGGGILGGSILGWRTVCAVERDAFAASILAARQNDKTLPVFPIWDDVTTFDGTPWRDCVDIISGGFPCQDISCAGKGAGITGERSGLWKEFLRIISEVRPKFAFIENSPMLTSRGLETVLKDLAALGFDAKWCVLAADQCGAVHKRERIWILAADPKKVRQSNLKRLARQCSDKFKIWQHSEFDACVDDAPLWQSTDRASDVLGDWLPTGLDEIAAIGNAQVPIVAAQAYSNLRNSY